MEAKLWMLLIESILTKHRGAGELMDESINMIIDLLCDVGSYNPNAIKAELSKIFKEVLEKYNYDWKYQIQILRMYRRGIEKMRCNAIVLGYYRNQSEVCAPGANS